MILSEIEESNKPDRCNVRRIARYFSRLEDGDFKQLRQIPNN